VRTERCLTVEFFQDSCLHWLLHRECGRLRHIYLDAISRCPFPPSSKRAVAARTQLVRPL